MRRKEEPVNPAAMDFLYEAILVRDEKVNWQGRPARLVVVRPAPAKDDPGPFTAEARVWLDEKLVPLAVERGGFRIVSVR